MGMLWIVLGWEVGCVAFWCRHSVQGCRDGASWVRTTTKRGILSLNAKYRRLAKEDAEKLTVPFICLFSKEDGTPELMKEYWEALGKNKDNVVEKYGSMHHGWMGARANLEDKENLKEFERG